MHRFAMLSVLVAIGLVSLPAVARAERPSAKKLRVIYWTGGVAHDYKAIEKVLLPAIGKLTHADITSYDNAGFLSAPDVHSVDVILMNQCYEKPDGVLTDQQAKTLLDLVKGGVGVVAVHASYYSFVKWDEYHELFGARFTVHGKATAAVTVRTVDKKHPIMRDMPPSFEITTELYQSTPLAKGCHVLAMASEKGSDKEFPSVWTRMYGKGRVVTILPGHWPDSYGVKDFQKLIARSVLWAGGRLDSKEGGQAK
jgi:type 1 glutamine amidotransferase